jgi:hypothetical protein
MTSIDNLSYYYFGSTYRLASISDATNNIAGFNVNGGTTTYVYDLNDAHWTGIINYTEQKVSNGILESINSKIQLAK